MFEGAKEAPPNDRDNFDLLGTGNMRRGRLVPLLEVERAVVLIG